MGKKEGSAKAETFLNRRLDSPCRKGVKGIYCLQERKVEKASPSKIYTGFFREKA
jgi:hypothetical protein